MFYDLIRPALFTVDPEWTHALAMNLMVAMERTIRITGIQPHALEVPELAQDLWGIHFPNPVGLAAGFDKDARAPHAWAALGFGFAELGTITAKRQPGNPRPRVFRLTQERALINRLGFNNEGAAAVAARLGRSRRRPVTPIGINIGKSRATPVREAAGDYVRSLRALLPFADYVAVNVSSPNTPGLRDLQGEEELESLLRQLGEANRDEAERRGIEPRPLLVKIAPDLGDEGIGAIVQVALRTGAAGLIATNTTSSREGLRTPTDEAGGLSGAPLRLRATAAIRVAYRAARGALPIIGVGGIFDAGDAYEKIRAGASLVQVYTGFIYQGPSLPRRIVAGLRQRLRGDGAAHVSEVVGRDAGL